MRVDGRSGANVSIIGLSTTIRRQESTVTKIHMTEKELKRVQKKVQTRQIAAELDVTEAWVKKVEREIASLKKIIKAQNGRYDKIWKWVQEQQRKEGWEDNGDT